MERSTKLARVALFALTLVAGAMIPAGAGGSPQDPEIVDRAGDANVAGSLTSDPVPGTPASLDGADITAVWYETATTVEQERDESGDVVRARLIPTGVAINVRTVGAPQPSFGPTLEYLLNWDLSGCDATAAWIVRGPSSGPEDPADAGRVRFGAGCADPHSVGDLAYSVDGNVLRLEIPLSADLHVGTVIGADASGALGPGGSGAEVHQIRDAQGRRVLNGPAIDWTAGGRSFQVGSDVARWEIDCSAEPGHTACAD